jgi:hypothetical protein
VATDHKVRAGHVVALGGDYLLVLEYVVQFVYCLQVFFVLRKKNNQISYLHLWHHTTMPIVPWVGVKYIPGEFFSYTLQYSLTLEQTNIISIHTKAYKFRYRTVYHSDLLLFFASRLNLKTGYTGRCKYIPQRVEDSQKWAVLQLLGQEPKFSQLIK